MQLLGRPVLLATAWVTAATGADGTYTRFGNSTAYSCKHTGQAVNDATASPSGRRQLSDAAGAHSQGSMLPT